MAEAGRSDGRLEIMNIVNAQASLVKAVKGILPRLSEIVSLLLLTPRSYRQGRQE